MQTYWKENGALVLQADDDDDMEDLLEWVQEYQGGAVEMLEIDTDSMYERRSRQSRQPKYHDYGNDGAYDLRMQQGSRSGGSGRSGSSSQRQRSSGSDSDDGRQTSSSTNRQRSDRRPRR